MHGPLIHTSAAERLDKLLYFLTFEHQEVFVDLAAAVTVHQLKHQSQAKSQPLMQSGIQRIVYCRFALRYHRDRQKQL